MVYNQDLLSLLLLEVGSSQLLSQVGRSWEVGLVGQACQGGKRMQRKARVQRKKGLVVERENHHGGGDYCCCSNAHKCTFCYRKGVVNMLHLFTDLARTVGHTIRYLIFKAVCNVKLKRDGLLVVHNLP